jgi:hypothetical protein
MPGRCRRPTPSVQGLFSDEAPIATLGRVKLSGRYQLSPCLFRYSPRSTDRDIPEAVNFAGGRFQHYFTRRSKSSMHDHAHARFQEFFCVIGNWRHFENFPGLGTSSCKRSPRQFDLRWRKEKPAPRPSAASHVAPIAMRLARQSHITMGLAARGFRSSLWRAPKDYRVTSG